MISDYFSMAFKNFKRRKLRSWLTMLGIFISIATIFVLISLSLGLQNAVQEQFRTLGTDKFFIFPKGTSAGPGTAGAVSLTTDDVSVIEKVAGVNDITYITIASAEVQFREQRRFVMAAGYPLDKEKIIEDISTYKIDEGRFLKQGDKNMIMIGSDYKSGNIFSRPITEGDNLLINGVEMKVKSILQPIGNSQDDRMIYMSSDDFKEVFNSGNRVDEIIVQIQPGASIEDVAASTTKKLQRSRDVNDKTQDFEVSTPEELLASINTILNILTAFLAGVAGISLVVGAIGIANTMYTSVLERTKEIGVMKAVGAQNKDILSIFLIESGLLGLAGGLIGVILGTILAKVIEKIVAQSLGTTLLSASMPPALYIGCLFFSFLIGAISGTWPAWSASKIKPVDALRYE